MEIHLNITNYSPLAMLTDLSSLRTSLQMAKTNSRGAGGNSPIIHAQVSLTFYRQIKQKRSPNLDV